MSTRETRARLESLRADERGGYRKPFGSAHSVGIVYPASYYVGMSSLGWQIAYRMINERDAWSCERFFCDFEPSLSVENQQPPQLFNVLAFSLSYELDALNVLGFLDRAGMPLDARERGEGYPLIVAAGVFVHLNRAPLARFVDVFINGEAEAVLPSFLNVYEEHGSDRRLTLEMLSSMPGFEVTSGARMAYGVDVQEEASRELARVTLADCSKIESCSAIVTKETEFSDMGLVELARGCPYRCTFCFTGHQLQPYRVFELSRIQEWIAARRTWTDKFGLIASAVASYPQIDELCEWCDVQGVRISYSSLRTEDVTPRMIETLARSGARTFTIAPEAGSARLRRLLGKAALTDERIFDVLDCSVRLNVPNLKLYFMLGLPTETEEDVLAIASLMREVQRRFVSLSRANGRIGSLSVDLHFFVAKPGTPLADCPQTDWKLARKHATILQKEFSRIQNLKFQVPSLTIARVQQKLALGGEDAGEFLVAAYRAGGDWKQALRNM